MECWLVAVIVINSHTSSVDVLPSTTSTLDLVSTQYTTDGTAPCTDRTAPCTQDTAPCTENTAPCTAGTVPCTEDAEKGTASCTDNTAACNEDTAPCSDGTAPCSQERMVSCYSSIDSEFSAEFGALLPNLTRTSLDRHCRYVNQQQHRRRGIASRNDMHPPMAV